MEITHILLLFPIVLAIALLKVKRSNFVSIILFFWCSIIFSVFVSFRSVYVPDTSNYIRIYDISFFSQYDYEKGYILLQSFHKVIFGYSYTSFFAMVAIINLSIIYFVIRKLNLTYPLIAFAIYLSYYGIFNNFIVLRSGLASSFILLSWVYYKENKFKSVIFFLVALFLHSSAVIALPGYFILSFKFRLGKLEYFIAIIIFMFIAILGIDRIFYPLISPNFPIIGDYSSHLSDNVFWYPLRIPIQMAGVLSLYIVMDMDHDDEEYIKFFNLYLFGFFMYCFTSSLGNSYRLFMYFDLLQFYLISKIAEKYIKDNKKNPILYILLIYNLFAITTLIVSNM